MYKNCLVIIIVKLILIFRNDVKNKMLMNMNILEENFERIRKFFMYCFLYLLWICCKDFF